MTLTEDQARKLGYAIRMGAYMGGSDDRLDRYYIDEINGDVVDRRGMGYHTKREALEALTMALESEETR